MRLVVIGVTSLLVGCNPCEDTFTVEWAQASNSYLAELIIDDAEASFNVANGSVTDLSGDIEIESADDTSFTLLGIPGTIDVTIIDDGSVIAHGSADPPEPTDACENGTLDLDA